MWHKWTYLWNRNRLTDIENRLVVAKWEGVGGGMEWEVGVSRCKLLYIEWINNELLLYSTGNYIQYPMIGLPWWHSGWESACQCKGHGFEPWSGRIPHATEQLGPWATTAEPARLEPVLHNKRGPCTVMKSGPRLPQLEKALAQKWRPNTAKNKYK